MESINFAQILDGLEKDIFDLVSALEVQINKRLGAAGVAGANVGSSTKTAQATQPKWRGLRGILRWLWKGHSQDNPDYAHLYNQSSKAEGSKERPTLREYLEETRLIEGFADEIFVEAFGVYMTESSINISDLIRKFKSDFKNVVMKYKALIKSTPVSPVPAATNASASPVPAAANASAAPEAPRATAAGKPSSSPSVSDGASSETNPSSSTGTRPVDSEDASETKSASSAVVSKPATSTTGDSEGSQEKEGLKSSAGAGVEKQEKKAGDGRVKQNDAERKSKGHSANIIKWFKDAMEAKEKGGDEIKPRLDWLNPKGIIKPEKLPFVVAWMGTKSHKELASDEDVRTELSNALGTSFKDFVPQIGRKKSESLVSYLRKKMPMVSDDEFKRMVSELYGSEYKGSGSFSSKESEKSEESPKEGEEEKKSSEPDVQEKRIRVLSSLYDGIDSDKGKGEFLNTIAQGEGDNASKIKKLYMTELARDPSTEEMSRANEIMIARKDDEMSALRDIWSSLLKEKVLNSIQTKIIKPTFYLMDKAGEKEDARYFANWWKGYRRERMEDDNESLDSMVTKINSGAMFNDILKNTEVSKKKPEKKIKLKDLMGMLD